MGSKIIQGHFTANITKNDGSFLVLVTREGDCLPGLSSRSYASIKSAEKGAAKLLSKAAA